MQKVTPLKRSSQCASMTPMSRTRNTMRRKKDWKTRRCKWPGISLRKLQAMASRTWSSSLTWKDEPRSKEGTFRPKNSSCVPRLNLLSLVASGQISSSSLCTRSSRQSMTSTTSPSKSISLRSSLTPMVLSHSEGTDRLPVCKPDAHKTARRTMRSISHLQSGSPLRTTYSV